MLDNKYKLGGETTETCTTDSYTGMGANESTPQTIESKSEELLKFLADFKNELESFLHMPKPEMKCPTPEPPLCNPIEAISHNLVCAREVAGDIKSMVFRQITSRLRS